MHLTKISSTIARPNCPVNNAHSDNDSAKSDSPKSDFSDVDEDIGYFHGMSYAFDDQMTKKL
jgi:hypothetical protein